LTKRKRGYIKVGFAREGRMISDFPETVGHGKKAKKKA
jgi:hypothetical protein